MAEYERGDIVTYYFIIYDDGQSKSVQGWTDNKGLAKAYMDFHMCKHFKMKAITGRIEEVAKLLDENINDEIKISNIVVKNPRNKKDPTKLISIPATVTELQFMNEECQNFFHSYVGYSELSEYVPFMKNKYQKALDVLFMWDAVMATVHREPTPVGQSIGFDQLVVLLRSFPDNFGV